MGNVAVVRCVLPRFARPAAAAATLAVALAGCAQNGEISLGLDDKPKTSDIATASAGQRPEAELEKATAYWGEQHSKNPRDPKATLSYARNLKALGRKTQALGVLQGGYMFAPDNREFLSEYGRLALELGQVSTAGELLARAEDPVRPDWRVTSARGTVLAKQGNYKGAIELYEKALSLAPEQPSVMNNLAMAYTMDGQAERGEALLRQAASKGSTDPRLKQNLALVLGLQGKGEDGRPTEVAAMPAGLGANDAPAIKSGNWDQPLPGETARAKPAAGKPVDPDQIIRQALAAEAAKTAKR